MWKCLSSFYVCMSENKCLTVTHLIINIDKTCFPTINGSQNYYKWINVGGKLGLFYSRAYNSILFVFETVIYYFGPMSVMLKTSSNLLPRVWGHVAVKSVTLSGSITPHRGREVGAYQSEEVLKAKAAAWIWRIPLHTPNNVTGKSSSHLQE